MALNGIQYPLDAARLLLGQNEQGLLICCNFVALITRHLLYVFPQKR